MLLLSHNYYFPVRSSSTVEGTFKYVPNLCKSHSITSWPNKLERKGKNDTDYAQLTPSTGPTHPPTRTIAEISSLNNEALHNPVNGRALVVHRLERGRSFPLLTRAEAAKIFRGAGTVILE